MALFQKQRQDKKKKPESIIGKIIYGFLLFMPIIAVGVACLYTIFNKNAYQSYGGVKENSLITIANANQLEEGKEYYLKNANLTATGGSKWVYSNIETDIPVSTGRYGNSLAIYYDGTGRNKLYLYDYNYDNDTYTEVGQTGWNSFTSQITLTFSKISGSVLGAITTTIMQTKATMDNVFYYEMEKLEESDLFNWTKNTGTYTVMHNTTTLLGITNTYTPMIMTYWLIISIIYFLFDIALILIWAVHDKIHDLKDAI